MCVPSVFEYVGAIDLHLTKTGNVKPHPKQTNPYKNIQDNTTTKNLSYLDSNKGGMLKTVFFSEKQFTLKEVLQVVTKEYRWKTTFKL